MRKLLFFPVGISPKNENDKYSQRRYASLLISLYPEMDFRVINDEVNVVVWSDEEDKIRKVEHVLENLPENWD